MALTPFTKNYQDESNEKGFQFTFLCDLCGGIGYKTEFIKAKTGKKGKLIKGLGAAASLATSSAIRRGTRGVLRGTTSYAVRRGVRTAIRTGTNALEKKYVGMSDKWHEEHEKVFNESQEKAKEHFNLCPKCQRYVCDKCWNKKENLCSECAS